METRFSRREWTLWTLAAAFAWLVFHPRGTTAAVDGLQFACGAALCVTLQCLVLCRVVEAFRAHVLWLASAALWVVGGALCWWLPWDAWSEGVGEALLLGLFSGLWLATGFLQRIALRPLRAGTRAWLFVPLLGASVAMLLVVQIEPSGLRSSWPGRINWVPTFSMLGAVFGMLYGATTGAVAYAMLARPLVEHSARERI